MKSVLLFVGALLSIPSFADFAQWDQINNVKASPEFSADGLTVTASGLDGDYEQVPAVITTEQVFSGKHYWEMTVECGPDSFGVVAGLATQNPLIPYRPAIWDKGWGLMTDGTRGASNGTPFSFPDVVDPNTYAGDVLMFAYDADAGQLYLGKNGNWLGEGNPATGSNPTFENLPSGLYAALEIAPRECDPLSVKTNFGQSAFQFSVPENYFEGLCPDGRCKTSKGGGNGSGNNDKSQTIVLEISDEFHSYFVPSYASHRLGNGSGGGVAKKFGAFTANWATRTDTYNSGSCEDYMGAQGQRRLVRESNSMIKASDGSVLASKIDPTKESFNCWYSELEMTVYRHHRQITFGSGKYEGATGTVLATGTYRAIDKGFDSGAGLVTGRSVIKLD
jgi:hypothetical protein